MNRISNANITELKTSDGARVLRQVPATSPAVQKTPAKRKYNKKSITPAVEEHELVPGSGCGLSMGESVTPSTTTQKRK